MMMSIFIALFGFVFLFIQNANGVPIIATWYCSLTDPVKYSYCGNPSAGWVADCGISVQHAPCPGCGIAALNPGTYNKNNSSHTCVWQGKACGECWRISGPGGQATVMITDCCAGYETACTCLSCPTNPGCDWCAKGDNFHFDVDIDTFNHICANTPTGHCVLSGATQVGCP